MLTKSLFNSPHRSPGGRRSLGISLGACLAAFACASAVRVPPTAAHITRTEQTSGTTALLIAVSPVDEHVVWVSGSAGTWLRTTDGGTTWRSGRVPGADSLQFRDVHAVDATTAYLLSIGSGSQSRIYKTTDAGAHWALQYTNPDSAGFFDCMDFWDANHGIVIGDAIGTEVEILTTANGGATWTRMPPSRLPAAQLGDGSFAASGTCLVTRPGGRAWIVESNAARARVLRTTDFGRTWVVDSLPITTHSASGPQSIAFRDDQNGIALGGGNSAQPGDVLAASTADGGRTWTARASAVAHGRVGRRLRPVCAPVDRRRGRPERRRVLAQRRRNVGRD